MVSGNLPYDLSSLPGTAKERGRQKYAVVVADWNADITHAMADDAVTTLITSGVKKCNITVLHVPGSVELVYAASKLASQYSFFPFKRKFAAIIAIGCVIKGDTPHFDYVCQSVTNGITTLNSQGRVPVIFSVLTTLNKQQAVERVNGTVEKKGVDGAIDAIKMANI